MKYWNSDPCFKLSIDWKASLVDINELTPHRIILELVLLTDETIGKPLTDKE